MEKNYTLVLADGTRIPNLGLNGNNFVSDTELDLSVFEGNLFTLTVLQDEETVQEMSNAVVIQQEHYEDGWYICFREMSQQEIKDVETQAKIEYIAMMTEVELFN